MIYLNEGFFKPMFIFVSMLLLPISTACWILTFYDFRIELLIVTLIISLIYFISVAGIYIYSKTKKYFILIEDNAVIINYPIQNSIQHKICFDDIVKMEFYSLSSIRSWCMLYNYVVPGCAFITYKHNDTEICKHIGYPDFSKIRDACLKMNVSFVKK